MMGAREAKERAPPRPREPVPVDAACKALLRVGLLGIPGAALLAWALLTFSPPLVIYHPATVAALALCWGSFLAFAYFTELRRLEREARRRPGLELTRVLVHWFPSVEARKGVASVRADFTCAGGLYPTNFSLHLNMSLVWDLFVVGLSGRWECGQDGVMLIDPRGARFLGGASSETLGLPRASLAGVRAVFDPASLASALPDWGTPPGERARLYIEQMRPQEWLLRFEQPFVAFDAESAVVQKWWDPPADRLLALDPATGLDLLQLLKAFDMDLVAARGPRPTSSPAP